MIFVIVGVSILRLQLVNGYLRMMIIRMELSGTRTVVLMFRKMMMMTHTLVIEKIEIDLCILILFHD